MSTYKDTKLKAVTVPWVKEQKGSEKLAMLTAYDFPTARLLDTAGVDLLLVGDSVGTVVYGEENTLSVTIEDMIRHTRAVVRGRERALVIADMPFLSYQVSTEEAIRNAGRLIKEAGAQAVKIEGGKEMVDVVRALVRAGIPVMSHIGLTPQSINVLGNYRMHGKSETERRYLIESASALEDAGSFSIVLECVQNDLARELTQKLSIPTIGIGSGHSCDGQVLVSHDLLGLTLGHVPKFVEHAANLKEKVIEAARGYVMRTKTLGIHSGLKTEVGVQISGAGTPPAFRKEEKNASRD